MRLTRSRWALGLALSLFASVLSAQASRTWVSGVGDDANPGSRTAPCKTFAGAISKTAPGGEIDVLDPGGFGAVTITKAITLDGSGDYGSVLVSGTNGIVVNAGPTDVVVIRNLSINGIGTGLRGIKFIAGKALIIENCNIMGFTDRGISVEVSAPASVIVSNTTVINNAGNAMSVLPSSGAPLTKVTLDHVNFQANGTRGFYAGGGCKASIKDSTITENGNAAIDAESASSDVQVDNCDLSYNATGINVANGQVRISNCLITGNGNGVMISGGTIQSYQNNRINGNTSGNGPLSGTLTQQ